MTLPPRDTDSVRLEIARLTVERNRLMSEGRELGVARSRVEQEAETARRARDRAGVVRATAQMQGLQDRQVSLELDLRRIDDRLSELRLADPCRCGGEVPLLLLPVRIETRFLFKAGSQQPAGLGVRIFPDTVHVDALRRTLTSDEYNAGLRFWSAAWRGATGPAWAELRTLAGDARASWIAEATRPTNADAAPDGEPAFPTHNPEVEDPGAVARLLPDRFVVVARQGGRDVRATGAPIARAVQMGPFRPDERGAEDTLIDVDGVMLSPGSLWIADYAAATAAGLAITLPIPHATVDELIVFGVHTAIDPATSAAEFAELLTAHRHTDGLGIVPQGTATNNLDEERSGWSSFDERSVPSLVPERPAEPAADKLAAALGIAPAVLAGIPHAAEDEDALARAAHTVLWEPSWSTFLDATKERDEHGRLRGLGIWDRESLRAFHRDLVRGRGPLPTIRVGKQPYGILPVGMPGGRGREHDAFATKLRPVVDRVREAAEKQVETLPRIRPDKATDDRTLLDIFGMSPVSLGVRARASAATDMGEWAGAVSGEVDSEGELASLLTGLLAAPAKGLVYVTPVAALDETSKPVALPFVHESDQESLRALAAQGTKKEIRSVLQALAQIAWSRAKARGDRTGGQVVLADVVANSDWLSAADKEFALTTAAHANVTPAAQLQVAAEKFGGTAVSTNVDVMTYANADVSTASFGRLATTSTTKEGREFFGKAALPEYFLAFGVAAEIGDALRVLADAPIEKRRIAVAEALDVASHRVDPWLTAFTEGRRRKARAIEPSGIRLGAFGWVDGISPGGGRGATGFIHAPSPAQAATAGVLRSAYLSHNPPEGGGDGAFAIDLSSARVRDAMDLVDAVRQGQTLSEALGYRIERQLHDGDVKLARIILNLRRLAPLSAGRLVDRGAAPDADVAQHLAIANVVDGVELTRKDFAKVVAAASALPPANPYLDPTDWAPLTTTETEALRLTLAAAAMSLDAVADLLSAEGVHQLLQGNPARAGAALDAAANGDTLPPAPAVVSTPPSGDTVAHRLMIAVGSGAGWSTTRTRAAAEPALEAWCAHRLGAPSAILAAVVDGQPRTLADTGLSALDIVYAADPASLAEMVATALGAPAGTSIAEEAAAGLRPLAALLPVAAALRSVLATSTPLAPFDLVAPFAEPGLEIGSASLDAAFGRLQVAHAALASLRADAAIRAVRVEMAASFDIGVPIDGGPEAVALATATADRRLAASSKILGGPRTAETLSDASQALFGKGFPVLARMTRRSGQPSSWHDARSAGPVADQAAIRRWIAMIGQVQAGAMRFGDTLLYADALGATTPLRAVQLSLAPAPALSGWIGDGPAAGIVANYVVEEIGTVDDGFAGISVDAFTERLPGGGDVTTGLAFNAPSPDARPPQAWLLAITEDGADWSSDRVLATLRETRALSRLRGVTFEHLPLALRALPALYVQSHSLQGEDALDFSLFAEMTLSGAMRFVKEP